VQQHAIAIGAIAVELERGCVLDGTSVDVITAVGERIEADDGPPISGEWIAITSFVTGEFHARVGEVMPFHDPRVQAVPEMFIPSDRRRKTSPR
jgi:hypothetical protein